MHAFFEIHSGGGLGMLYSSMKLVDKRLHSEGIPSARTTTNKSRVIVNNYVMCILNMNSLLSLL